MIPSQCRHCCGEKLWGVCKNICGNKNPGRFMGVLGVEMMFLYPSLSGARGPSGDLVTFHQKEPPAFWSSSHRRSLPVRTWKFEEDMDVSGWTSVQRSLFRSTGNSTDMDISMVGSPCCEEVYLSISWIDWVLSSWSNIWHVSLETVSCSFSFHQKYAVICITSSMMFIWPPMIRQTVWRPPHVNPKASDSCGFYKIRRWNYKKQPNETPRQKRKLIQGEKSCSQSSAQVLLCHSISWLSFPKHNRCGPFVFNA